MSKAAEEKERRRCPDALLLRALEALGRVYMHREAAHVGDGRGKDRYYQREVAMSRHMCVLPGRQLWGLASFDKISSTPNTLSLPRELKYAPANARLRIKLSRIDTRHVSKCLEMWGA